MLSFNKFYKTNHILRAAKLSVFELELLSKCVVGAGCTVKSHKNDSEYSESMHYITFISKTTFDKEDFKQLILKCNTHNSIFIPPKKKKYLCSHLIITLAFRTYSDVLTGEQPSEYLIHYYSAQELYQIPHLLDLPPVITEAGQNYEYYVNTIKQTELELLHQKIKATLYVENIINPKNEHRSLKIKI